MIATNVNSRTHLEGLQNGQVILLRGIDESTKNLCVVGWAEDAIHGEEGTAAVLNEPIYCMVNDVVPPTEGDGRTPTQQVQLIFIAPEHHIPLKAEFFEYSRVENYEASTSFGAAYFNEVNYLRGINVKYYTTRIWNKRASPQPAQPKPQVTNTRY